MKDFFKDVFDYHLFVNQKLAEQLINNMEVINNRSTLLFCHLLNAHQIWNARILGKTSLGVNDMHPLEECLFLNRENHTETLFILNQFDFQAQITYTNSTGSSFHNSVQEILFHIINHATHHRGQIIMDIRRKGIEPIITDYIFYKR